MNWQTDFLKFPKDGRVCLICFKDYVYELAYWVNLYEGAGIYTWSNLDDGPELVEDAECWCEIVPPNIVE